MRLGDLNYQHLRYFYTVAQEGSVLRAGRVLGLSPSTVSAQIKQLEDALGQALLERAGRGIVLTAFGKEILVLADQIFSLGETIVRTAGGEHRQPLRVGASAVLPKLVVRELLCPASLPSVHLEVKTGSTDELLGDLTARRLDAVLSDGPTPSWVVAPTADHAVIQSTAAIFGTPALRDKAGCDLPRGLAQVPWLVPPRGTTLRAGLEHWWSQHNLNIDIAVTIDDSAVMKALGDAGLGVFAAPVHMLDAILSSYDVVCIDILENVYENAFVITRAGELTDAALRRLCRLPPVDGPCAP